MVFPLPPTFPSPPDSGRVPDVAAASRARMLAMREALAATSFTSPSASSVLSGSSRLAVGDSGRTAGSFAGERVSRGGGVFCVGNR